MMVSVVLALVDLEARARQRRASLLLRQRPPLAQHKGNVVVAQF